MCSEPQVQKMLHIWWDQLLKRTEKITGSRSLSNTINALIRALKNIKISKKMILQLDNTRPQVAFLVKKYLETLKWEALFHPFYSPDVAPSDDHLFRSTAHGLVNGSLWEKTSFFNERFVHCLKNETTSRTILWIINVLTTKPQISEKKTMLES